MDRGEKVTVVRVGAPRKLVFVNFSFFAFFLIAFDSYLFFFAAP